MRTSRSNHTPDDIEANPTTTTSLVTKYHFGRNRLSYGALTCLGLREPNTLAYALCDSPIGLLSLVLAGLRHLSPKHTLSRTEIINITQLAWLPGPEGAMRFWSAAQAEDGRGKGRGVGTKWSGTPTGVTVFLGEGGSDGGRADEEMGRSDYVCPAWAGTRHNVVWTKRQEGRAGIVALERTDAVVEGIKRLTREVLRLDKRLGVGRFEEVVVGETEHHIGVEALLEEEEENDVESPDTIMVVSPTAE
jgi:hypothetical protein